MKAWSLGIVLVVTGLAAGCGRAQSPTAPAPSGGNAIAIQPEGSGLPSATGGGRYLLQNAFDTQFAFSAVLHDDGQASGNFHQFESDADGTVDFTARVTCLAIDGENHRAWIGGVITENRSTNPGFTTAIHQPGHDVWFRVLDNGQGPDDADRTTFLGFEGAIPSSQAYCDSRPWPAGNARTWPVTAGNLSVHP